MSNPVRPFHRPSNDNPEVKRLLEQIEPSVAAAVKAEEGEPYVKPSRLSVYLSPEEHWKMRERALAARMSLNDYVRSLCFPSDG
jgi:hypothetical protein